jgi:WD40 repeat protein
MNQRRLAIIFSSVVLIIAALACSVDLGTTGTAAPAATAAVGGGEKPTAETTTAAVEATTAPPSSSGKSINADNAANLVQLQQMQASSNAVVAVAASPTTHQIASFSNDRIVRLWNGDTGEKENELSGHVSTGWHMMYSPDGSLLASGAGYEVILWDPQSGARKNTITTNAEVFRLGWSSDSQQLGVVGRYNSKLSIFDVGKGTEISKLASPKGVELWSVVFSPDGKYVAIGDGGTPNSVYVFDAKSYGEVAGPLQSRGASWDIEFSPDGKYLTTCNASGTIYSWTTADWKSYDTLSGDGIHPDGCLDGVFGVGSDVYISVGSDGVMNVWNVASGDLIFTKSFGLNIITVSITGDGELIALAMSDGTVRVWGLQ